MKIQILIEVDEMGKFIMTAPFASDVLCYGLLEKAKDTVRIEYDKITKIGIVGAGANAMNALGPFKGQFNKD